MNATLCDSGRKEQNRLGANQTARLFDRLPLILLRIPPFTRLIDTLGAWPTTMDAGSWRLESNTRGVGHPGILSAMLIARRT